MDRFELWFSDEDGYFFFAATNSAARHLLSASARLIWEVEAPDFYTAQSMKHEFLEWEPYVPPNDD